MNLLRNLSIGGKIVFVVAIVIALQLGVAIVGRHSLGAVKEGLAHIVSEDAEQIVAPVTGALRLKLSAT